MNEKNKELIDLFNETSKLISAIDRIPKCSDLDDYEVRMSSSPYVKVGEGSYRKRPVFDVS